MNSPTPDRPPLMAVTDQVSLLSPTSPPAVAPAGPASGARVRAWARAHRWRLRRAGGWLRTEWSLLLVWGALAVFAATMLWLIVKLIRAIGAGLAGAGHGLNNLAGWATRGPITHTINDPMRAWLDTHSAGLPATGHDLWIVWLAACTLLYITALAGSPYARYGWAGIGALSGAGVYAGAGTTAGPAAAGLTAAVWLLLSLPVYARTKRASVLEQIALSLAQRRAAREHTATR